MSRIGRREFLRGTALGGAALAGGAAAALLPGIATAQAGYPAKPVRLIAPLAAGGGLDFLARLVADAAGRELGQQLVVENRTGAGGTIGIQAVVQSPPDGYTILVTTDNVASAPYVQKLPGDFTESLAPIALLAVQPLLLAVHPSLGVDTLEGLLKYARENPGQGVATSGVGSNQHVLVAWLSRATGANFTHVPYRGAGQAIGDLVGGQVKIACLGPTALLPHHKSGAVKVLAQSGEKRLANLPDFPTLAEAGVKDVALLPWYAAFAPAGTPEPVIATLNAALNKATADAAVRERFASVSIEPAGGTAEELGKFHRGEAARFERLVREFGISAA